MADITLLDGIMSGQAVRDEPASLKGLRIGLLPRQQFCNLDAEVEATISQAITLLTAAGVEWVEEDLPELADLIAAAGFPISLYETLITVPAYLERYGAGVTLAEIAAKAGNPDVAGYLNGLLGSGAITVAAYHQALSARNRLQYQVSAFLADNQLDAILMPAAPLTSRPVGGDGHVMINKTRYSELIFQQNSDLGSISGLPGLVLPAGLGAASRLPVSLEIDGAPGADHKLLAIGEAMATALPPLPPPTP